MSTQSHRDFLADLVVLGRHPSRENAASVERTMVGGRWVVEG